MIRRTAAVTAASIAGVVLAGGAAIGANIGILSAADDGSLGDLSAQAVVTTTAGSVTPVTLPSPADTPDTPDTQVFAVDAAGTVEVGRDDTGVLLGEVVPAPGWIWRVVGETPQEIRVRFAQPGEQLDFVAVPAGASGIEARIDRVPVATTTPAVNRGDDDHDLGDHEYEHEGRDDDD